MSTTPVRTTKGFLKPQALRDGYVEQVLWKDGAEVHNVTLRASTDNYNYFVKHSTRLEPDGVPVWLEWGFDDLRKAREEFTRQSKH